MGKFEIFKDTAAEFRFRLKAKNGEIILTSEGYTTKANCHNGISSVKNNAPNDKQYSRLNATNGSPYFNLKATNGEIIGTSEMYSSNQSRQTGIASVKSNAPGAEIVDLS